MFHVKRRNADYEIIVLGGGHAGIEAALASARLGLKTLLVTIDISAIARMSCNPAIGGLAKGHLVSEIDALGGEMAKVIDKTGLQFRVLNKSKGRAVWSLRAQADKIQYSLEMIKRLLEQENLDLMEDMAVRVLTEDKRVIGITTEKHGDITCNRLIITAGTFLNGLIHIGLTHFEGGRIGERAVTGLTESLISLGIKAGRLKTGTPPRINRDSIDFSKTTPQYGDENPIPFSFQTTNFKPKNIPCFITYTNKTTHQILFESLDRSPLYTGVIKSVGPRYCPSIEDKIVRFKDKDSHQIFLEPEWENSNEIYVNGFSTSLPIDAQIRGLRTIPGLEKAEIIKPAYAIEYDFFPAFQLYRTLESKIIKGLYFAGQVNGTSGYEEAAAQGLIAGINASLSLKGEEPLILDRSEAYIGVLIDDLILKSPTEPYRMFTSSAEYRLLLRFDNADQRLVEKAERIGLLPNKFIEITKEKMQVASETIAFLKRRFLNEEEFYQIIPRAGRNTKYTPGLSIHKVLKRPEISFDHIKTFIPQNLLDRIFKFQMLDFHIETEIKYEGYINRSYEIINSMKECENALIPQNLNYNSINIIRKEAREKLNKIKPETLSQASRIPGILPSDITSLMIYLKKMGKLIVSRET